MLLPAAQALLKKAEGDPVAIRSFIVQQAQELAAGCDCTKPLQARRHTYQLAANLFTWTVDMEVGATFDEMGHQECAEYQQ